MSLTYNKRDYFQDIENRVQASYSQIATDLSKGVQSVGKAIDLLTTTLASKLVNMITGYTLPKNPITGAISSLFNSITSYIGKTLNPVIASKDITAKRKKLVTDPNGFSRWEEHDEVVGQKNTRRFDGLARRTGKVGRRLFKTGKDALAGAGAGASAVGNAAGNIGQLIVTPFKALQGPLSVVNQVVEGIRTAVEGTFGSISRLVQLANPAVFQQFTYAVQDTLGVLGQALTPILQIATGLIRQFGDTLQTMRPTIDQLVGVVGQIVSTIGELLVPVLEVVAPLMGILTIALKVALPIIQLFVEGIKLIGKTLSYVLENIIELYNKTAGRVFGKVQYTKFSDLEKKSSQGASIRESTYLSTEELGRKTRASAFSNPVNYQKATAESAKEMAENTRQINEYLKQYGVKLNGKGSGAFGILSEAFQKNNV